MNAARAAKVKHALRGNALFGGWLKQNDMTAFCGRYPFSGVGEYSYRRLEQEEPFSTHPASYFELLKTTGRGFFLASSTDFETDRFAAGFINSKDSLGLYLHYRSGGVDSIQTVESILEGPPKRWKHVYLHQNVPQPPSIGLGKTPESCTQDLVVALEQIMAFSQKHVNGGFMQSFQSALNRIKLPPSEDIAELSIYGGMLTMEEIRLFSAANMNVFGALGSWNDVVDWTPEYERVSAQLFGAITQALICVVNQSYMRLA